MGELILNFENQDLAKINEEIKRDLEKLIKKLR